MAIVVDAVRTHTTLECLDVAQTLRFYHEVLGLSTAQHAPKGGLWRTTNNHMAANLEVPRVTPQPYWNYHALAVAREDVDELHAAVARVADAYAMRELRLPERETRFGIGTYGFALCDLNGNWWRIEEAGGPFGPAPLPAERSSSIVPAGPLAYVTLEVLDLAATHSFYHDVLGLEAALRDGAIHVPGRGGINIVAVPVQGELQPQSVLNHIGLTLRENQQDAVRELQQRFASGRAELGMRKVMPATSQHGSFSFYFEDLDTNWWELETLEGGLNPWERASLPDDDERLVHKGRGASTIRAHAVALTA